MNQTNPPIRSVLFQIESRTSKSHERSVSYEIRADKLTAIDIRKKKCIIILHLYLAEPQNLMNVQ